MDQQKDMTEIEQTLRLVRITCRFIISVFVTAITVLVLFVLSAILCGVLGITVESRTSAMIVIASCLIGLILSIFITMRIEHFGRS